MFITRERVAYTIAGVLAAITAVFWLNTWLDGVSTLVVMVGFSCMLLLTGLLVREKKLQIWEGRDRDGWIDSWMEPAQIGAVTTLLDRIAATAGRKLPPVKLRRTVATRMLDASTLLYSDDGRLVVPANVTVLLNPADLVSLVDVAGGHDLLAADLARLGEQTIAMAAKRGALRTPDTSHVVIALVGDRSRLRGRPQVRSGLTTLAAQYDTVVEIDCSHLPQVDSQPLAGADDAGQWSEALTDPIRPAPQASDSQPTRGEYSGQLAILTPLDDGYSLPVLARYAVNRIGRSTTCDIVLEDDSVSRHHANLVNVAGSEWAIKDLGSTNGILINGVRVDERTVRNGDEIRFGEHGPRVRFELQRKPSERAAR